MPTQYQVVFDQSINKLASKVGNELASGWSCQGGICTVLQGGLKRDTNSNLIPDVIGSVKPPKQPNLSNEIYTIEADLTGIPVFYQALVK